MDNELLRRIEDLYQRAYRTNQAAGTPFLDPAEQAQATVALRSMPGVRSFFSGGFEEAERRRLIFMPDYFDEDTFPIEDYLSALRVELPFGSLTHRDYLGSLMGLGIKREMLGDITVFEKHAFIIAAPQIAPYIKDNLIKVGRFGVSVDFCPLSQVQAPEPDLRKVSGTVASLRLDAVASLAFGVSRTAVSQLIREGRLSLNHLENLSPSAEVEEGDLLSLRGSGRAKLSRVGGTSKKGRLFIELLVTCRK